MNKYNPKESYTALNQDSKRRCEMCGNIAVVLSSASGTPLCWKCKYINDEARSKR